MNNLQEFIAYTKANQDKMQYCSAGVGSGTHLPCALLNMAIGVDVTHVPYRGAGPAHAGRDRRAHRLHVRHHPDRRGAGQGRHRQGHRGDVAEARADRRRPADHRRAGRAGVEATVWNGFFFPKGTPQPIVRQDEQGAGDMIARPDMRKKLEALGLDIVPPEQRTPEYLRQVPAGRHRALGQGDPGRLHQHGLSAKRPPGWRGHSHLRIFDQFDLSRVLAVSQTRP